MQFLKMLLGCIKKAFDVDARLKKHNVGAEFTVLRGSIPLLLALLSPVFSIWLIYSYIGMDQILDYAVTFLCGFFNFTASALFHSSFKNHSKLVLKRVDYAGIFLIAGGSGFPSFMALLDRGPIIFFVFLQWTLVLAGSISALVTEFSTKPKLFRYLIYVATGLPYVSILHEAICLKFNFGIIISMCAALSYGVGGFIYVIQKPNPIPNVFGYHEVFHASCFIGVILTTIFNISFKRFLTMHPHVLSH